MFVLSLKCINLAQNKRVYCMQKIDNPWKDFDEGPKDLKKMFFKSQYTLHMVQQAFKTHVNSNIGCSVVQN